MAHKVTSVRLEVLEFINLHVKIEHCDLCFCDYLEVVVTRYFYLIRNRGSGSRVVNKVFQDSCSL